MYVCMNLCDAASGSSPMRADLYVCIFVFLYVCMYVCIFCKYVCVRVFLYECLYVCMYVSILRDAASGSSPMRADLYVCVYFCMYVCVYVCVYACVCVCMNHVCGTASGSHTCACGRVCMYLCVCVCMYTYIHRKRTETKQAVYVCMYASGSSPMRELCICMYIYVYTL
jgi:hypothetical protein